MKPDKMVASVIKAISWMLMAGLNDFGKAPKTAEALTQTAEVWTQVLRDRNVRIETIEPAARVIASRLSDFPSAGFFAEVCQEERFKMFAATSVEIEGNAVFVLEVPRTMPPDERLALVAKEARKAGHLLALPATGEPETLEEARDRAKAKFANLESKAIYREKVGK